MLYEVIWGEASQYGGYRSAAEIVSGMLSPLHLADDTYLRKAISSQLGIGALL